MSDFAENIKDEFLRSRAFGTLSEAIDFTIKKVVEEIKTMTTYKLLNTQCECNNPRMIIVDDLLKRIGEEQTESRMTSCQVCGTKYAVGCMCPECFK